MQYEPFVDTASMKDVITVKHAAHRFVLNGLQAYGTLTRQKLPAFQPDQHFFDLKVLHLLKPFVQDGQSLLFSLSSLRLRFW